MPWGLASAGVGALGSIIGGGQAAAGAKAAADAQMKMYQQTRTDLQPYNVTGQGVLPQLSALATGSPTGGGPDYVSMAQGKLPGSVFTQQDLMATPGYQFVLGQGLKSTQAAQAAKGLGVSGAALKGAAAYSTGLADNTYSNRFNEAQQNFNDVVNLNTAQQSNLTNQYNRLSGVATLGEDAAAKTAAAGTQAAANQGNYLNQQGLSNAAGTTGVGSAISQGINNYLGMQAYNARTAAMNPSGGTYSGGWQPSATGTYGGQQAYTGPTNTGIPDVYNM